MNLPDVQQHVYGQPQQTSDGSTVITVTKVRSRGGAVAAIPVGIFVIHDGKPTWTPAIDSGRVAWIGVLTGLVAAAFATGAMIRRPPWPDITITEHR
ncbi:hypothetical protein [Mycobacterium sp.]|jgi:hypothetical protein|uniref:hypothetical protein n=1 Tax=Mycobacterium sp. TaxID=1785 RepID=UPI002D54196F|nr:hypothetical protein [Mycobacterium sp.]HZA10128.1 hypothetical protein [Mycobacterium sp.]